ncbi:MAG TPA: hypothetical protein PLM07_08130 [Candidatus Rifleibacterium sp.]|nr:hypothetical protein [Candidatus Rifleibacterium sp.]HPT45852.1 hypothetical protein [Candidatus Rifleibacterium sp.]
MSGHRHEGSLHNSGKKKRVKGWVDRVTGGIVVVVIKHPDDPDATIEIYVPIENFKKRTPKEGEYVSVDIPDND